MEFGVWAPGAHEVEVVVESEEGSQAHAMTRTDLPREGWWHRQVPGAGHGTRYSFRLDGSDPRPDPRSGWQPDGVHGPSAVVAPLTFRWSDSGWSGRDARGAVFYELHVGTFTPEGTFAAAAAHLDHLVDLGVEVVEVLPVSAFDGRWGWGYDGVAPYAVHEPYGGPEAFAAFVDACHAKGLAVALDCVYNHLGPSGNYLGEFGPYFTDKHETPWGAAVNLDDEGSVEVRRWIVDNALRWFRDFHVDALRLDAVHALVDDSPVHVLQQLADEVAELSAHLGRPLSLVAESDLNDAAMVTPTAEGGRGMTAQWDDDVHHALHAWLTGERQGYYADFGSPEVLATTFTEAFWHAERFSSFRGEDWGRRVDRARVGGHSFLGYLQTHDQVGNRAVGERIGALVPQARLAAGAALYLLGPFTPMIFMGEEWDASTPWQFFTDFPDPELGAAVSKGRRSEFGDHGWSAEDVPDPQDAATRERSVLRWDEVGDGGHARVLRWYTDLLALRRAEPDLRADDLRDVRVDVDENWVVLHRGAFRVVVSTGSGADVPVAGNPVEVVLAHTDAPHTPELLSEGVRLVGESVAVVRVANPGA
ncbi:malto-oligosyltrehalose trehalohydrolase [Kineococcus rubinsiae]|uniref:malto-oligosyltrehalose trehalohydrolase n=1 Tax=Kineococcus rubinsiae TaxID=2609562 RepID=UPI0014306470|nr:malto-oligosyltrehalose trehalohydrolase [Kineococcus rubinsiae]NIZ89786.1 malto-oligosyltrehalose trehalohydrolase [Kineococcus rubinsiae]